LVGSITGSTVQNSYSMCSVDGNKYVGGLTGYSSFNSAINSSYATGSVTGNTNTTSYVGGFIGYNGSYISNCYSDGNVTRTSGTHTDFGSFAGYNKDTIKYCYSLGSVYYTGTTAPTDKGFVGSSANASYTNNLFDSDVSNQTSATGATGKTTVQMKTQSTYVGWDFTDIWEIIGGDGANYPRLQENPDEALPVELISFTTKFIDGKVLLKWKTATEMNNYGFEIQRTMETPTQNQNDIQNWRTIGFVEGAGNSILPKSYQFTDNEPLKAVEYYYRLKQIDEDGSFEYSEILEVNLQSILTGYSLHQNFPNPFNPTTTIKFELPEKGVVDLRVYNIIGKEIAQLVNQEMEAGSYEKEFDAEQFSSGIYIYSLKVSDKFTAKKKMLILK